MEDAAFYRKAFTVTGQNGFEDSFTDAVQHLLLENAALTPAAGYAGLLSGKNGGALQRHLPRVHGEALAGKPRAASVDELVDAYLYLVSHSAWM